MTTYSETFELKAPATRVWTALLDEDLLVQWLADAVRVEAKPGGVYRFWGAGVIWGESEAETAGEILELDTPRRLVFSWRWKGHASRVTIEISQPNSESPATSAPSSQETCRLAIEQTFETFAPGSDGPGPDMAACHWRIAFGNLASVLATGRAALRPDYSIDTAPGQDVELEIEIAAPPERVFRALMDPAQVRIWMQAEAPEIDADRDRYSYGWTRGTPPEEVGPSRIVEYVPDRLLVFDWNWTDEAPGRVRWELLPIASGTRLRLVHENFTELANVLGWSEALVEIRNLIESEGR